MGTNVWSWSGEAWPRVAGEAWRLGDPLIGDPPHEGQSWYSINDTDKTTRRFLTQQEGRMEALVGRSRSRS